MAQAVYESEAKLLIKIGRENVSLDPSVSGPIVGMQQSRENEVKSELAILTSRYLAERVVETVGAEALLGSTSDTLQASTAGPSQGGRSPETQSRQPRDGRAFGSCRKGHEHH